MGEFVDQFRQIRFYPRQGCCRLSELIEEATDEFLKQDPDPLDDRHPAKTYPSCILGHLLKVISRYEEFMNKVGKNCTVLVKFMKNIIFFTIWPQVF